MRKKIFLKYKSQDTALFDIIVVSNSSSYSYTTAGAAGVTWTATWAGGSTTAVGDNPVFDLSGSTGDVNIIAYTPVSNISFYNIQQLRVINYIDASGDLNLTSAFRNVGLEEIYKEGYHYKKAGVIVMGLTPNSTKQYTLFNQENPKHEPLMQIVDRLNKAYGNNKIKLGSQSLDVQFKMKQQKLSPRYSTNINEIIEVNT